jgi:hypothetical protein
LIKKITAISAGLLSAFIIVLIVNELIKVLLVQIITGAPVTFSVSGISLHADFPVEIGSAYLYLPVLFSPVIFTLVIIELSLILLSKNKNDHIRIYLVLFQIVLVGYLIIFLIAGLITLLFESTLSKDWNNIFLLLDLTFNQSLIFLLFIFILFLTYINIHAKRLRKNIPAVHELKTKGIKNDAKK